MLKISFIALAILVINFNALSQKVTGNLKFEQGQELSILMNVKTKVSQEAMGQAIDLNVDGTVAHSYKVTNTTEDNTTLNHKIQRITYTFDGMGRKQNFDSDKPKDMEGQLGKPMKELLDKTYNMIIDPSGLTMMTMPEKIELANTDPRMMLVMGLLKDIVMTVQPPQKNEASFFKILPDTAVGVGDSWSAASQNESGNIKTSYTISDINDSTIVVKFTETSTSVTKAEMMGMETTSNLNNKTTGTIILDRITGIMKQKNSVTDSNGTTEVMGGSLPVTSKITTEIKVVPVK